MSRLNKIRHFLLSRRAVSPIVATLLLIVISVAGAVLVFQLIGGIGSQVTGQPTTGTEPIAIEGASNWNKLLNATTKSPGTVILIVINSGTANSSLARVNLLDDSGTILAVAKVNDVSGTPAKILINQFTISSTQPTTYTSSSGNVNADNATLAKGGAANFVFVKFDTTKIPNATSDGSFKKGTVYRLEIVTVANTKVTGAFKAA